jgi:hypothetical protein
VEGVAAFFALVPENIMISSPRKKKIKIKIK